MTELTLPDPLQGAISFAISQRILDAAPSHETTLRWVFDEIERFHNSENDTINTLLIVERVIRDELITFGGNSVILLVQACLGMDLAPEPLINSGTRGLINTEEQLASDVTLAVFMARHGKEVYDRYGNPVQNQIISYAKTRNQGVTHLFPIIANQYVESLIRDHIEDHDRLADYIKTRETVPDSEETVAAFHDYLANADTASALREAWL